MARRRLDVMTGKAELVKCEVSMAAREIKLPQILANAISDIAAKSYIMGWKDSQNHKKEKRNETNKTNTFEHKPTDKKTKGGGTTNI